MSDALTVHQALALVMRELPAIGKERHQGDGQERGVQYAYRGIEQITREVQTLFAKHGVVCVPFVESIDVKDITVNSKPWTDTTLIVSYTLVGPDGSELKARCAGIGRDNSDKGANKAMTQAFKYLLLQVLCISDAKDDADGTTVEADAHQAPPPHPFESRVRAVFDDIKKLPEEGKKAIRAWAAGEGYKLTGPFLLGDEGALVNVEFWLGEYEHNNAQGQLVPA